MSFPTRILFLFLTAFYGLTLHAAAQQITTSPYAVVRGWAVKSVYADGIFMRCAATFPNATATLELSPEGWLIGTHLASGLQQMSGSFDIDKYSFEAEFWPLSDNNLGTFLDAKMLALLRNGSVLAIQLNGGTELLSLKGSAATITKLEECVARGGGRTAAPAPTTPQPPMEDDAQKMGAGCPAWGAIRSLPAEAGIPARFINRSDRALNIYWVDYNGMMVEYAGLLPGESFDVNTYVGHYWLAKDFQATCHGGVLAPLSGASTFELY